MRSTVCAVVVLAAAALVSGCETTPPAPQKTAAKPVPQKSPIIRLGPSARCNRATRICRYDGVASVGLTRLYFGDSAAARLTAPPATTATGEPAPPATPVADPIFKPTPTQSCDTLVAACYDEAGASSTLTAQQFGAPAAKRLDARRRESIVRYGTYITCDKLSQVCYDRLGAGVGVTRLYLGEPESERLMKRLQEPVFGG